MTDRWVDGYIAADVQGQEVLDGKRKEFANPFETGTEEWAGFEEGWYDATQK